MLAEVRVEADVGTETGIEHRTTVMPVLANLDGEDHVEPTVEQTFIRFQVAKAREEAVVVDIRFVGHNQSGVVADRAERSKAQYVAVRSGKGSLARTVAAALQ